MTDAIAMAVPRPARFIRAERCEKCKFYSPIPNELPECRADPPHATGVMIGQQKLPNGQVQPMIVMQSGFPRVQPDWFCGRYTMRFDGAGPQ